VDTNGYSTTVVEIHNPTVESIPEDMDVHDSIVCFTPKGPEDMDDLEPLYDVPFDSIDVGDLPGLGLTTTVLQTLPSDFRTAGALIFEPDGRVWMCQPTNGFPFSDEGYPQFVTFPKGTRDPQEDVCTTAVREVFEETGLAAALTSMCFDYLDRDTICRYYVAKRHSGHPQSMGWESQAVVLIQPDQIQSAYTLRFEQDRMLVEWILANRDEIMATLGFAEPMVDRPAAFFSTAVHFQGPEIDEVESMDPDRYHQFDSESRILVSSDPVIPSDGAEFMVLKAANKQPEFYTGLLANLEKYPNLQVLHVMFVAKITTETWNALAEIVHRCPKLTTLVLNVRPNDKDFADANVHRFVDACRGKIASMDVRVFGTNGFTENADANAWTVRFLRGLILNSASLTHLVFSIDMSMTKRRDPDTNRTLQACINVVIGVFEDVVSGASSVPASLQNFLIEIVYPENARRMFHFADVFDSDSVIRMALLVIITCSIFAPREMRFFQIWDRRVRPDDHPETSGLLAYFLPHGKTLVTALRRKVRFELPMSSEMFEDFLSAAVDKFGMDSTERLLSSVRENEIHYRMSFNFSGRIGRNPKGRISDDELARSHRTFRNITKVSSIFSGIRDDDVLIGKYSSGFLSNAPVSRGIERIPETVPQVKEALLRQLLADCDNHRESVGGVEVRIGEHLKPNADGSAKTELHAEVEHFIMRMVNRTIAKMRDEQKTLAAAWDTQMRRLKTTLVDNVRYIYQLSTEDRLALWYYTSGHASRDINVALAGRASSARTHRERVVECLELLRTNNPYAYSTIDRLNQILFNAPVCPVPFHVYRGHPYSEVDNDIFASTSLSRESALGFIARTNDRDPHRIFDEYGLYRKFTCCLQVINVLRGARFLFIPAGAYGISEYAEDEILFGPGFGTFFHIFNHGRIPPREPSVVRSVYVYAPMELNFPEGLPVDNVIARAAREGGWSPADSKSMKVRFGFGFRHFYERYHAKRPGASMRKIAHKYIQLMLHE
jgi:8-oxo-dGTP pyrophosphatase MutT (NUDIX family)